MSALRKIILEPAWILHHYPYRDSSLLLEIFTREHGRLGLVARGARAAKSRWRGQLQGFTPLLLSWSIRGDLGTLTDIEMQGNTQPAAGRQLLSACYLNELIMRLVTRHDPHPELFVAYAQSLEALAINEEAALRLFEKCLLQELGYGLLLDREAETGLPVSADALYEYRLEQGPVRCNNNSSGLVLHGSSLLALFSEALDDQLACREIKRLMRAALSLYLGARPLRTREVMREFATLRAKSDVAAELYNRIREPG
ncbi:MAG: DNA repair protein RecO [Gammaproteobacteria bacterium]|nr:DNA repair protein RecO [Gammaproteobacteria bacterium]